jgi:hypothetical protein
MTFSSVARFGIAVVIALNGMGPRLGTANADDASKAEIAALRQALAKYEDPYVAVQHSFQNFAPMKAAMNLAVIVDLHGQELRDDRIGPEVHCSVLMN